jgi:uncharacterized membrane protein
LAGVSYVPLLPIITLMFKPDSKFVQLHAKQGLLITGAFFVCMILALFPIIQYIAGVILALGLPILGIFSAYQAIIGNWWKIPFLGDFADLIPINWITQVTAQVTNEVNAGQIGADAGANAGQNQQVPPGNGQAQ